MNFVNFDDMGLSPAYKHYASLPKNTPPSLDDMERSYLPPMAAAIPNANPGMLVFPQLI